MSHEKDDQIAREAAEQVELEFGRLDFGRLARSRLLRRRRGKTVNMGAAESKLMEKREHTLQ